MTEQWGKAGTPREFKKAKAHHVYKTKDGVRVPSVTTVLGILAKWRLLDWAWEMGMEGIDYREYRGAAANVGTLIHLFVECNLLRQKPDLSDYTPNEVRKAGRGLRKFIAYKRLHRLEPVVIERPFVSEEFGFGGTIDFFGLENDVNTLLDFKSGKGIYESHLLQVAAYKKLLEEGGYLVDVVKILRIGREEGEDFEVRIVGALEERWQMFLHCLEYYKLKKSVGKVLVPLGKKK